MGMLNAAVARIWNLFAPRGRSRFEQQTPSDGPYHSTRILYAPRTEAGVQVTHDTALTYGAVYACTRIIAETVASLTWHVYRRQPNGGKQRAPGMVEDTLRDLANPETTAFSFREQIMASALLWGNGFAEIERDGAGRVVNLWQIAPDRVQPDRVRSDGRLVYVIDNSRQADTTLEAEDCFHLHGLGFDGVSGYSVVRLAARSIGIGLAVDKFGGAFYGNGTALSGVLETDQALTDTQRSNIKTSWDAAHQGPSRAFQAAVLEGGLKWRALGMPMTDAQFLENRTFQVQEICRWFRVPPHKLAELTRATFSNIEHQTIEFVQDTIMPWAIRLEQEANRKLFGQNRERLFTKLNLNALLRGDAKSRFDAYATARQWGWLSANDIRELEDMNPIGPQGDVYLVPANMFNAKQYTDAERQQLTAPEPEPTVTVSEGPAAMGVLRAAHRDLLASAFARISRREAKWLARGPARGLEGAERSSAIMGFLGSAGHREYALGTVSEPALAFARVIFGEAMSEEIGQRVRELTELMLGERLLEAHARLQLEDLDDDGEDARWQAERLLERIITLRLNVGAVAAA
jgi:HK97 family phage portal protein